MLGSLSALAHLDRRRHAARTAAVVDPHAAVVPAAGQPAAVGAVGDAAHGRRALHVRLVAMQGLPVGCLIQVGPVLGDGLMACAGGWPRTEGAVTGWACFEKPMGSSRQQAARTPHTRLLLSPDMHAPLLCGGLVGLWACGLGCIPTAAPATSRPHHRNCPPHPLQNHTRPLIWVPLPISHTPHCGGRHSFPLPHTLPQASRGVSASSGFMRDDVQWPRPFAANDT